MVEASKFVLYEARTELSIRIKYFRKRLTFSKYGRTLSQPHPGLPKASHELKSGVDPRI